MELDEWAAKALRLLESGLAGASKVGIVFPPSPDGISSSVIMEELLTQRGVESELVVSTPESMVDVVENCSGRCDSLIFLDLPPHGRGPIQVASELYRGVIILDHGSSPLLSYRNTIRLNLDVPGISTSLLTYMIALEADEDNDLLSWVASSGFFGECTSEVCEGVLERARLSWPELLDEGSMRSIQEALVAASFLGEDWIYLTASALRESFDDPDWFLSGTSATASLIRSKIPDVYREIELLLAEPTFKSVNLMGWEVQEPYQRFVVSLVVHERGVPFALSYFYDPPLGLLYLVGDPNEDLFALTREAMGDIEGSVFGGRGFSSLIVDSDDMGRFMESLARILGGNRSDPSAA